MGLPATADTGSGNSEKWSPAERELIRELIAPYADGQADRFAAQLLAQFGSLFGVFRAAKNHASALHWLPKPVLDRLHEVKTVVSDSMRRDALANLQLDHLESVLSYLKIDLSCLRREVFRVLYLDGDNRLVADRMIAEGTVDRVHVHVREIVRIALEYDAVALIVAHNHVSSSPEPTIQDKKLTSKILVACQSLDLSLLDHIIVSVRGCFSMQRAGLL